MNRTHLHLAEPQKKESEKLYRVNEDDMDELRELVKYLGGVCELLDSDADEERITITREYLRALLLPAYTQAEDLWCDIVERDREEAEQGGGAE